MKELVPTDTMGMLKLETVSELSESDYFVYDKNDNFGVMLWRPHRFNETLLSLSVKEKKPINETLDSSKWTSPNEVIQV